MDEEKKVTPAAEGTDKAVADKDAKAAAKEAKAAAKAEKKAEKAKEKLQKERAKKEMHDIAPGGVSKAEEARLKRKADMEKSQKRQEEKARKRKELTKKQKRIRIIAPITAVVLALVLFFLGYFGVYDRHTTAVKLQDGSKISVAEYEYYYRSMYNYYYNMSYQYESYYSSYYGTGAGASLTGFDYTKAPADQELPSSSSDSDTDSSASDDFQVDEEYIKGDTATWDDYFCQAAIETAQLYTALYEQAVDAGYEMTEDETTEMNEFFDELKSNAEENEYSLDAYIRNNYGKGMNKALLQEIYIKQTLASDYSDDKKEQYAADVTDDEINTYLSENKAEYETASLRYYNFSATVDDTENATDEEITAANEEAKAKAEAFLAEADDSNWTSKVYEVVDEAYKSYYEDNDSYSTLTDANDSTLKSYFTEEAAEWIENEASSGDKKLFSNISESTGLATYYAILVTEEPTLKEVYPVTVRHLLIQVSDDDSDTDTDSDSDSSDDSSTTTHTDAEAKALAEQYYQEWKDGDATDDSFKELAVAHSEDSGVSDNEGLYEDITPSSSYVQEFLDWCFADGRKAGDSGIIKSEYGYHIMYCVSVATEPQWKTSIRSILGENAYNDFYDSAADADEYQIKSKHCINLVRRRENRYAQKTLANMSASSSTAS